MEKFNFIIDDEFRNLLISDYAELNIAVKNEAIKSVLILAGSIIEAVLIDYLSGTQEKEEGKNKYLKYDLNDAITKCYEMKVISLRTKNLSDVVRNYRNLIHPGKSIRMKENSSLEDANIAKSLMEIIIKEISIKKQETYGYTADQILSKVENDYTSQSIWKHLIKKLHDNEKERLLLKSLPKRYFELHSGFMTSEYEPDTRILNIFNQFFLLVYNSAPDNIKQKVAHNFLLILSEGSDIEVIQNINSLFSSDFLRFYSEQDFKMIKVHLLSQLENINSEALMISLDNFSEYLDNEELKQFSNILIRSVLSPRYRNNDTIAQSFLSREYSALSKDRKLVVKEEFEKRKSYSSATTVKKLDQLFEYIDDDLPF